MTPPQLTICVTCVGGRLIYDVIRALRDASDYDVFVVGIDADASAAGRLLCDAFFVLPMAERDPEGWVRGLLDLRERVGLQGLVCLSDQEACLAAQNHQRFSAAGIHTSVSSWHTVQTMTDKLLLLQALSSNGLDVGAFAAIDTAESAYAAVTRLGYPATRVVIKPRRGRGSRGVMVCDASRPVFDLFLPDRFCGTGTFEQISHELIHRKIGFADCVAVPYWDGPVFDTECLVSKGNVVLSAARRRQLRNPFWPTSTGHIVDMDTRILRYAESMCRILNVEGAADFDIVLRPDGTPAPFDASARFSGSIGGSYTAGANFLAQLARVMFGLPLVRYDIRNHTPLRPFTTMAAIPNRNADDFL